MKFNAALSVVATTIILGLAVAPLITNGSYIKPIPRSRWHVSHNLILGSYVYGDRLLHQQTLHVPRKFFGYVSHDFKYPFGYPSAIIDQIKVIDLKTDGTGGYPRLAAGGIGYRNATIRFESQWNHGLHFNISIYGK